MAQTVRIEIPIEVLDETEKGLQSATKNLKKMKTEIKKTQEELKKSSLGMNTTKFDRSQEKVQKSLLKWAKDKYEIALSAKDSVTPVVSKISSGVRSFSNKTWTTTMKLIDYATKPLQGIIKLLKNPIFQVGVMLGVSFSISDAVETYKAFQSKMSEVKAISGANDEEMALLTEKAIQVGADTKFSAEESAQALTYMAMAGWKTKEMLNGIDGVMDLAAASGEDLGMVSDIVTDALTAFGLAAKDSTHFADVLAMASSNSNTNVGMMGETFKYVAPVAGAFRYTIEDTAIAIGLMANAGIKASMSGTSLRRIMTELSGGAELTGRAFGKIKIVTQKSDGSMRKFRDVMDDLREAFSKMTEAEKVANAEDIAGKTGMAGLLAIVNASAKDYDKLTQAVDSADGASRRMAKTMLDNLSGALEYMQGEIETTKTKFGERLEPYIVGLAKWIEHSMPVVDKAIEKTMDFIDRKVREYKKIIQTMLDSKEWEKADFFGKIKIAWDKIVEEPFLEWWNGTGKRKITTAVQNIGYGLGEGISLTFMGLLGIDIDGVAKEGESIGASFAKGFSDGFDLVGTLKNIGKFNGGLVSSASALLPGGESAGLSSLISAIVLGKVIGKVGKGVSSVGSWGKSILLDTTVAGTGGTTGGGIGAGVGETATQLGLISLFKKGIGSFSLGQEAMLAGTGIVPEATGMATGTGLMGLFGKTGMALGSGATSSAGMVAVGAGAVTGGLIAGGTVISGLMDIYRVYKSEDELDSEMYGQTSAVKLAGVGTGALTGAAIGSIFGGIGAVPGALIGAGIGGVASLFGSQKIEENYAETKRKIEEEKLKQLKATSVTGYEYEDLSKFLQGNEKLKDLKKALDSTSYSAEEFRAVFQKIVYDDVVSHFGDVTLSLKDIEKMANKITSGGNSKYLDNFNSALESVEHSLQNVESSFQNLDKWNWKVGLGFKLSDEEIESYKTSMDRVIEDTQFYLNDKRYEVTTAVQLLLEGGEQENSILKSFEQMYGSYGEKLATLKEKLKKETEKAFKDGIISIDEEKNIAKLQKQIQNILKGYENAQERADYEVLKIKFGNTSLDYNSFVSLQEELKSKMEETELSYDEALKVSLTNLYLSYDKENMTEQERKELDEKVRILTENHKVKIDGLHIEVQSFQFKTIGEAYAEELERSTVLSKYKGGIGERLQKAVQDAINNGVDVVNWDTHTASRVLGLDQLELQTQEAIARMVSSIIGQLPKEMQKIKLELPQTPEEISKLSGEFLDNAFGTNFRTSAGSQVGSMIGGNIGSSITGIDMQTIQPAVDTLNANVGKSINESFSKGYRTKTKVDIIADYNLINPKAKLTFSGEGLKSTSTVVNGSAINIKEYNANGSISSGKRLSWICEEGPEAIIPLVPGRRKRALELYEQTGKLLGVAKYAKGGITGSTGFLQEHQWDGNGFFQNSMEDRGKMELESSHRDNPVELNVSVNPNVNITIESSGNNEDKILSTIRKHLGVLADALGGELANKIEGIFKNMPVKS